MALAKQFDPLKSQFPENVASNDNTYSNETTGYQWAYEKSIIYKMLIIHITKKSCLDGNDYSYYTLPIPISRIRRVHI